MNDNEKVQYIYNKIRVTENYIPRNYSTIGGMWTVDTWSKDDVSVKLCDEGYTIQITTPHLNCYKTHNRDILFSLGDSDILDQVYNRIKE